MTEPDRSLAAAMADPRKMGFAPPLAPSLPWVAGDFPAARENMRRVAGEIAEMSANSLEQARSLIEELRDARQFDEMIAIQTKHMTALFKTFADGSRRIGSVLAELPREATQAGYEIVEASVEVAQEAAEVAANSLAAAAEVSQNVLHEARAERMIS